MSDERLLDLLAARATEGLDLADARELERRGGAVAVGDESWDLAAAELDLAWSEPLLESPPEELWRALERDASAHLDRGSRKRKAGRRPPATDPWKRIASMPDAIEWSWRGLEDARFSKVQGRVVWSDTLQRGLMRCRGLPGNDSAREQYQLWIVDPARDRHPVDGGVFDVPGSRAVVVAIDAKLQVFRPQAFALTLEKPGGVVVSGGPLLVVAKAR